MLAVSARMRTRRRSRAAWAGIVLCGLWLAVGSYGVVTYIHRYWVHRGFPPPVTPAGVPRGRLATVSFFSRSLGHRETYLVYTPPGYQGLSRAGRRFPVLYLLHPPPGRPDVYVQAGAINVRSDILVHSGRIRRMILVMPYATTGRFGNDTEWANTRAGAYESFLIDLVHEVDHRFATLRNRRDRGLAGLSEGGYGAINVGLHHLGLFSVLESWSGYFTQTPTQPFAGASAAALAANSPSQYVGSLAARIRKLGLRTYLYQGVKDEIRPWRIRQFAGQLAAAGAYVRWGFFPGGHDWGLWRRQTPHMLMVASDWFSHSPRIHPRSPLKGIGHPEHPRAGKPHHHKLGLFEVTA